MMKKRLLIVSLVAAAAPAASVHAQGQCGDAFTPTFVIQGSATSSPSNGNTVSTEAIVVGDFQGASRLRGFYIQDPSGDGNTATSDGIYVVDGDTPAVDVSVGDRVRVTGTVSEASGNTQLSPVSSVQICSTGNSPPAATAVDLPEPVQNDLERYENMLVTVPETLTVTGNSSLGQSGELVLSSNGRLFQQNNFDRANSTNALAIANLNQRRYVLLDDGRSPQNPDPTPYLDANNTRRLGDTVANLTGVLTFNSNEYRLHPTVAPVFTTVNLRPPRPASVEGAVVVAGFNGLDYFNGDGAGGGFPTAGGASTAFEFDRQRTKLVAAMLTTNADLFALSEVENDGTLASSAIQDLVNGLNAATAPGTYAFREGPTPGFDQAKNTMIYKPAVFTPVGAAVNDIDSSWTGYGPNPLAQTFAVNGGSDRLVLVVAQLASRVCGGSSTGLDADQANGQGCNNLRRTIQADALLDFVAERQTASGENRVLVMGNLNAFGEEDPIFRLEDDADDRLMDDAGGLIDQVQRYVPAGNRYTSQTPRESGYANHVLASKWANLYVMGTAIWPINADEPSVLDYNVESKSAAQQALNVGTAYRSAEHDPVIVGLDLRLLANIRDIRRSGVDIVITYEAIQGKIHQLERAGFLSLDTPWARISDSTAETSGPAEVTDPEAVFLGKAFYQVRIMPEPAGALSN